MRFDELQELVPYAKGGKEKILRMQPYTGITLALPGRHAEETTPKGGDFVVMVTDSTVKWREHQFKHDDIFMDLEQKAAHDRPQAERFVRYYGAVVLGADPGEFDGAMTTFEKVGVNCSLFLRAVQCLAVAEHRRYARYEEKFGGRYLPLRFAAGIVDSRWTAAEAMSMQKRGRPGVEQLERQKGTPELTQRIMNA